MVITVLVIILINLAFSLLKNGFMNHLYRVATVFRVTVRWFLACATFWLAANVGWLLLLRGDENSMLLAKICGALAVLASATWQWLFTAEQRHEMVLAKHQARVKVAPVQRKPVARPVAVVGQRSMPQMMPQAV
jgi:hypothetical protein